MISVSLKKFILLRTKKKDDLKFLEKLFRKSYFYEYFSLVKHLLFAFTDKDYFNKLESNIS